MSPSPIADQVPPKRWKIVPRLPLVAESSAIERYLNRKFELLGSDAFESTVVETFVSWIDPPQSQIYLEFYTSQGEDPKKISGKQLLQNKMATEVVSEKNTPAFWKVKTAMDELPGVKAWRATDDYKALSKDNFDLLGFY
ncbi:hypothetical protein EDD11_003549 [Mortierella claussenii]|nr:hypothetical protein EDD11_003549 [Mortierella claussenii]